jgi:transcriptional regulator NrdR family protein
MSLRPTKFRCPFCNSRECPVISMTSRKDRPNITRRRKCGNCGKEFITHETPKNIHKAIISLKKARVKTVELYNIIKDIHI